MELNECAMNALSMLNFVVSTLVERVELGTCAPTSKETQLISNHSKTVLDKTCTEK